MNLAPSVNSQQDRISLVTKGLKKNNSLLAGSKLNVGILQMVSLQSSVRGERVKDSGFVLHVELPSQKGKKENIKHPTG